MASSPAPSDPWKLFKFWFPLFIYSGIIFYVSSLPSLQPPVQGRNLDKILHIGEYIPFGFLAARALFLTRIVSRSGRLIFLAGFLAFLYGISDEFHQSFVDGRFASGWDVLADTGGGLIGAWIFTKWASKKYA